MKTLRALVNKSISVVFVVATGLTASSSADAQVVGTFSNAFLKKTTTIAWIPYAELTYTTSDVSPYGGDCTEPTSSSMNDGNTLNKTTWGSDGGSGPYIRADLGSTRTVNAVQVGGNGPGGCSWGSAAGSWGGAAILVQVSTDGSSWTTVANGGSITYSNSSMSNITFPPAIARYVRLYRASGWFATGQFRIGKDASSAPPEVDTITASASSAAHITVSWTTGANANTTYWVAYQAGATAPANCNAGGGFKRLGTAGTSKDVPFLAPSTQYSVRVCAANPDGVISTGKTATATTPSVSWYSGIAYTSDAVSGSCNDPSESDMNDESVGSKTTWGSAGYSTSYLKADLGSTKTVSVIRWGGQGPSGCSWGAASIGSVNLLQVSTDNSTWTTVAQPGILGPAGETGYSTSAMTNVGFTPISARYVRIYTNSSYA